MKTAAARRILDAYPPMSPEEETGDYREARKLAESNIALKEWWERRKQLDAEVRCALRGICVPDGLEESLNAGMKDTCARPRALEPLPDIRIRNQGGGTAGRHSLASRP